ncbi:hypothetical protein LKO27_09000 [Tessaracoccus sp. OS52]|uniref:hypothetical protein n=1 Tax=Tessaracoccus sp. OS52 TaxID=2886691 RepID=UPI001D0FAFC8|nr:hypothetical protein [Tessaracoccus sp. OS52]MCC2593544.1 hypothetical protein [Tessaracoccus sp. OS52]
MALVLIYWEARGVWFWVGVVLGVGNVIGILAGRMTAGSQDTEVVKLEDQERDSESYRLEDFLGSPGVRAALGAGPSLWQQVSYLEDEAFEPITAEELAGYVWLENHDGWEIGLDDDAKPYLDLDVDEEDDRVVSVLKSHPAVADAYHEDREVYRTELRGRISAEEFAALAARALVEHHNHARSGMDA